MKTINKKLLDICFEKVHIGHYQIFFKNKRRENTQVTTGV